MIVYCSHLPVSADSRIEDILGAAAAWIGEKAGAELPADDLIAPFFRRDLGGGHHVECCHHDTPDETLVAVRLIHPDRDPWKEREWRTEIGVRRRLDRVSCSVLLEARESGTRIRRPTTTRPRVVPAILERCGLSHFGCGGFLHFLRTADAEDFRDYALRTRRWCPIVVLSDCSGERCPVTIDRLVDLLTGVAQIAVIPDDTDPHALAAELGTDLIPYDGAITILWPPVAVRGAPYVPTHRVLPRRLFEHIERGRQPENELLALICNRTNARYSRSHISPEIVQRRLLESRGGASPAEADESMRALVMAVDRDQRKQIDDLKAELRRRENEAALLRSELEREKQKRKRPAPRPGPATTSPALPDELRRLICRAVRGELDLEDCLRLVEVLYCDRLVVLDSARRSAREAALFNDPVEAFRLLGLLCTDYYDALIEHRGDQAGRGIFGNSFASKESETVEKNQVARRLRTFDYKGKPCEMMRHLKIGIKDSLHETFRAHFHWDHDDRKLVLGHCGRHLDFG